MFDDKDIEAAKQKNAKRAAQKELIQIPNINHEEKARQVENYRRRTCTCIIKALKEFPSAARRADTYVHIFGKIRCVKIFDGNVYANDPEQSSLFIDFKGRVYYLSFTVKSGLNSFGLKKLKGSKKKAADIISSKMVKSFPYTNIKLLEKQTPEELVKQYFVKMLVQEKDNV